MSAAGLDIDIDAAVGLKPEPATPTTALVSQKAELALTSGPQALVCKDMLSAETLTKASAYARQLLPTLLADPTSLAELGNESVAEVNALASRMMHGPAGPPISPS